jgi:hypothetical protein
MKKWLSIFNEEIYRNKELNYLYYYYNQRGLKLEVSDRVLFRKYCKQEQLREIFNTIFIWLIIFIVFILLYNRWW